MSAKKSGAARAGRKCARGPASALVLRLLVLRLLLLEPRQPRVHLWTSTPLKPSLCS